MFMVILTNLYLLWVTGQPLIWCPVINIIIYFNSKFDSLTELINQFHCINVEQLVHVTTYFFRRTIHV